MQNYSSLNVHYLMNFINTIRNGLILASRYELDEREVVKNTIALTQQSVQNDEMINVEYRFHCVIYFNTKTISKILNCFCF